MQTFVTTWNAVAQTWGERLLAVVWQSTVLTLVAALLVALVLRRSSPSVRYWIWQILAIKLLVMPFWSWALPWRGPLANEGPVMNEAPVVASGAAPVVASVPKVTSVPTVADNPESADDDSLPDREAPTEKVKSRPVESVAVATPPSAAAPQPLPAVPLSRVTWQSWLFLAWCGLVLAQVLRLTVQRGRLSRLLKQATPADMGLAETVATTAARLAVRRIPQTLITQTDCSPFVCGVWRPKLILPRGLPEKLSPAELSQVLLHELAHIRRHDLIWSWIGEIARMAYFFHPAAHWISYQARLERELACDQLAMAVSGHGPHEYAATLVQVVSHASEPSVFKSAASASLRGDGS